MTCAKQLTLLISKASSYMEERERERESERI
jgi:hypothetical protein